LPFFFLKLLHHRKNNEFFPNLNNFLHFDLQK
jgi:hypothetical protein